MPVAPRQNIFAMARIERIMPPSAIKRIIPSPSCNGIIIGISKNDISGCSTENGIVAGTTVHIV